MHLPPLITVANFISAKCQQIRQNVLTEYVRINQHQLPVLPIPVLGFKKQTRQVIAMTTIVNTITLNIFVIRMQTGTFAHGVDHHAIAAQIH